MLGSKDILGCLPCSGEGALNIGQELVPAGNELVQAFRFQHGHEVVVGNAEDFQRTQRRVCLRVPVGDGVTGDDAVVEDGLEAPSALNTALALRQAIWRKSDPTWAMCGIPEILHVDHGSDFTSNHLERTAIDLHIRLIYSTIARPQGRGKIERFFGTINTELLASLPGHLGPGSRKPQPSLDLPRLDQAIGAFIATYNERPHQELGHSPRDAWVSDGWLPWMPDSLELLDGLLLTVPKHRTVQRDGIHFQGQRYLAPTVAPFVGHTVTIRYDPRDISEIRVYDHDTFICVAIDEAHPNLRLSLRDIESARRARRRELRRTINERIPALVTREEPRQTASTPRRRRLRTYEEDEP